MLLFQCVAFSYQIPTISFPTGETFDIDFYVTLLNSSCPLVLGYNWLTRYNPLIDWVSGSITFCSTLLDTSILMMSPAASSTELTSQDPPILTPNPISTLHISFINGAAFACALQLPGVQSFSLSFSDPTVTGKSASCYISFLLSSFYRLSQCSDSAPDVTSLHTDYSSTCYTFHIFTYFQFQVFFYCSQLLHVLLFTLPHAFTFLSMCSDSVHELF